MTEKIDQIRIALANNINVNPTINLGLQGINDSALDNVSKKIDETVNAAFQRYSATEVVNDQFNINDDLSFVFYSRYNIEKELRRIWGSRSFDEERNNERRFASIDEMTKGLARNEIIPYEFIQSIRDIYSICSPIIHGSEIENKRLDIVRKNAPKIIGTLRKIA